MNLEKLQEFDMWEHFGLKCGSYSSEIDRAVIEIMKLCQRPDPMFMTDIAKKLELPEIFVELVQNIICSANDLFTYGCSPRGCFPEDDKKVSEFIRKCEGYYKAMWEE